MPTDAPQPGWYPDPYAPGLERWWDGTAWSGTTRPPAFPGPAAQHGSTGTASGRAPASGWGTGRQPGQRRGAHRAHQPAARDGRRPASRGRKAALAGVAAAAVGAIAGGTAFALTSSGTPATQAAAPPASATARAKPAASAKPAVSAKPATRAPGSRPPASQADVTACHQVNSAMTTYGNISHRTETDVQHLVESLQSAERAAAPGGTIRADLANLVAAMERADGSATGSGAATLARDCTHVTG